MDKVLAESTALDEDLLFQDEEQYDKLAQSLVNRLSKLSHAEIATARDYLESISPSHTILYLSILLASIEVSAANGKSAPRQLPPDVVPEGALWPLIAQLLLEFDPVQARYCGAQLMRVVDCVALGAEQTANFVPAIQLLHHVILRLDSSSSTLTSTHRTYVRLCLLAQAYAEAVDILDRPIYHIPASQQESRTYKHLCSSSEQTWTFLNHATGLTQPVSSRTYLEYYLMGALCHLALRRYKDAIFFLEVVITAPALQNVASSIMVEAYKKWVLVGLLLTGIAPTVPRSVNQAAMKHIRAAAKPYDCVADVFKDGNIDRLRSEIEAANAIWQVDENYGLMVEVYHAFRKFSVLKLAKTFGALSVTEIARRTSPDPSDIDEARSYLKTLIANGDISAVITETSGGGDSILRFLPGTASQKSETQIEVALASQTEELKTLLAHVQNTEHRMEVSKEYIEWLKKLKKRKEEEKKSGGAGNSRPAAVDDVDEDMMEEF